MWFFLCLITNCTLPYTGKKTSARQKAYTGDMTRTHFNITLLLQVLPDAPVEQFRFATYFTYALSRELSTGITRTQLSQTKRILK
jgi:hypothetical protein